MAPKSPPKSKSPKRKSPSPTKPPEPRFSIPDATPRSSKTPLVISGFQVYIYGLENLTDKTLGADIAVLYLAHNRTRTYLVTEGIAHEVLHRYRTDERNKKMDMIAVTFNMRNHGDREISAEANKTWKDGNETHGQDIMSLVDGSALDFKLVMAYLPAYLTQFNKIHTYMFGVSLGGHVAWRMPALAPDRIKAICIVVGCPNLTALLLSRLKYDPALLHTTTDQLYTIPYATLAPTLNELQLHRWPHSLHEVVSASDWAVQKDFPNIPLLLMGGVDDPLVPVKHTRPWVEERQEKGGWDELEFYVQENTGHSCTKEMVAKCAEWLGGLLAA